MRAIQEHTIKFHGLKDQRHFFTFELDKDFFLAIENEEFKGGQLNVAVDFDKKPSMMVALLEMCGTVQVLCDRCNEPLDYPVEGNLRQIFKLSDDQDYADEEVIVITPKDSEVNLTASIYECLVLSLPARKIHGESECDPEVITKLNSLREEQETNDPRWNALRGLKHQ